MAITDDINRRRHALPILDGTLRFAPPDRGGLEGMVEISYLRRLLLAVQKFDDEGVIYFSEQHTKAVPADEAAEQLAEQPRRRSAKRAQPS